MKKLNKLSVKSKLITAIISILITSGVWLMIMSSSQEFFIVSEESQSQVAVETSIDTPTINVINPGKITCPFVGGKIYEGQSIHPSRVGIKNLDSSWSCYCARFPIKTGEVLGHIKCRKLLGRLVR